MVVDNKGTLTYIRLLKEDLSIFRITPNESSVPDFKAGQFVTIGLHIPSEGKIIRRAYSIASQPERKEMKSYGYDQPESLLLTKRCTMVHQIIEEWFLSAEVQV